MPRITKNNPLTNYISREEIARIRHSVDSSLARGQAQERKLQIALQLIKTHITAEQTAQNEDLHNAVGLIVDVARQNGLLTR